MQFEPSPAAMIAHQIWCEHALRSVHGCTAATSQRARGSIEAQPSGALRVRVYAGYDPVTNLTEMVGAGPKAEAEAERVRTRLLNQVDESGSDLVERSRRMRRLAPAHRGIGHPSTLPGLRRRSRRRSRDEQSRQPPSTPPYPRG